MVERPLAQITCIYCKKYGKSREHLLPRGLGGNLTANFVCRECNNSMSIIDSELAESVLVNLPRLITTKSFPVNTRSIITTEIDGVKDIELKISNGLKMELMPQIHLVLDGENQAYPKIFTTKDAHDEFVSFLKSEIDNNFVNTHISLNSKNINPRFVKNRSKAAIIRATSEKYADAIKKFIKDEFLNISSQTINDEKRIKNPSVHTSTTSNEDLTDRGISKIAFNFLALATSPEAVLAEEFDSVRDYIRLGSFKDVLDVKLIEDGERLIPLKKDVRHEVLIINDERTIAFVTLYERFTFRILFPKNHLRNKICKGWYFDGERSWNEPFDIEEVIVRMQSEIED